VLCATGISGLRHCGRFCLEGLEGAAYFITHEAQRATVASLPPCWTLAEIRLGLFLFVRLEKVSQGETKI
jgi:hypothetical protein